MDENITQLFNMLTLMDLHDDDGNIELSFNILRKACDAFLGEDEYRICYSSTTKLTLDKMIAVDGKISFVIQTYENKFYTFVLGDEPSVTAMPNRVM